MSDLSRRLREGITLYSAVLENADTHMQLLDDAADLIDKLTCQRDELLLVLKDAVDGMGGSYALWSPKARAVIASVKEKSDE